MPSLFENVMNSSNVWTGKDGVKGVQDILNNPQLQDKIQADLIKTNFNKLADSGAIQQIGDTVKPLTGKLLSGTGFSKITSNPINSLADLKSAGAGIAGDFKSSLTGAGVDVATGRIASLDAQKPAIAAKIDGIIGAGGLDIENKVAGIKSSIGSTIDSFKSSGQSIASNYTSALSGAGVDVATGKVASLDSAFAAGGASGALGNLGGIVGIKAGIPASFASKMDAVAAEVESAKQDPSKINQFKLAKFLDAPLLPQLGADATVGDVKNLVSDKASQFKSAGQSIASQFSSSLSGAGVDMATGKVASLDSAFAAGGTSGALSSMGGMLGGISNSIGSKLPGSAGSLGNILGSVSSSGNAKIGGLLENASKFGAGPATEWAKGMLPSGNLASSMDSLAKQGEFAVNFSDMKLPSAITGPTPLGAFGSTVDRKTLDSAMTKIIGSNKIATPKFVGDFEQSLYTGTKDEDLTYTGNEPMIWDRVNSERLRRGLPSLTDLGYPRPPDQPKAPVQDKYSP
jgi:hypothetical protein